MGQERGVTGSRVKGKGQERRNIFPFPPFPLPQIKIPITHYPLPITHYPLPITKINA
jgi:hypothetical protein